MSRSLIYLFIILFISNPLFSQIAINENGAAPDPSAALDIAYSNKGLLPPRLTGSQILALPDPVAGLMVFNISSCKPVYFNGENWLNFDGTYPWIACGDSLPVNHVAGDVAPVSKAVTYGTVYNVPGETSKCWITSNLGADHQANAVNDATEESAGWYWQFNRPQGFKHDGVARTPNTSWITTLNENSDWTSANDPCSLELGYPWRIPTYSEWVNVWETGGWINWIYPWSSLLKLHAAGYLSGSTGQLGGRGFSCNYWSSHQYSTTLSSVLMFDNDECHMVNYGKAYAFSVRCVLE